MMGYPTRAKIILYGPETERTTCLGLVIKEPAEEMELELVDFNIDYRIPRVSVSNLGDANLSWASSYPEVTVRGTGYPKMSR